MLCSGCTRQQPEQSPEQLVAAGWDAYRIAEYTRAVAAFETAAARAPGERRETRLQALYGLATTWQLRRPDNDNAKAEAFYRQILAEAPEHDLAAWSLLGLARLRHVTSADEEPDFDAVRQAYQRCVERFPDHRAGQEALIYQQSTHVASLKDDEARHAVAALEQFVAGHPKSPFVSPAYKLLAQAHITLRQPEKALAATIKGMETEERDPLNPIQEKALQYWLAATIAEFDAGDFAVARKYYRALIEEYPTDIQVYGARTALKRMDDLEAKLRAEQAR
jgi:tetratricopeptide (TPR) repeat protein